MKKVLQITYTYGGDTIKLSGDSIAEIRDRACCILHCTQPMLTCLELVTWQLVPGTSWYARLLNAVYNKVC